MRIGLRTDRINPFPLGAQPRTLVLAFLFAEAGFTEFVRDAHGQAQHGRNDVGCFLGPNEWAAADPCDRPATQLNCPSAIGGLFPAPSIEGDICASLSSVFVIPVSLSVPDVDEPVRCDAGKFLHGRVCTWGG